MVYYSKLTDLWDLYDYIYFSNVRNETCEGFACTTCILTFHILPLDDGYTKTIILISFFLICGAAYLYKEDVNKNLF